MQKFKKQHCLFCAKVTDIEILFCSKIQILHNQFGGGAKNWCRQLNIIFFSNFVHSRELPNLTNFFFSERFFELNFKIEI